MSAALRRSNAAFSGVLAVGRLFEQLLDTGIRAPWKFAKAGRGRAGASGQQGSEAEGREQPQASDHVSVPDTDQISVELYQALAQARCYWCETVDLGRANVGIGLL